MQTKLVSTGTQTNKRTIATKHFTRLSTLRVNGASGKEIKRTANFSIKQRVFVSSTKVQKKQASLMIEDFELKARMMHANGASANQVRRALGSSIHVSR